MMLQGPTSGADTSARDAVSATAPTRDDVTAPSRRQRLVMGTVSSMAGLLVYVLSAGPMVWINEAVKVPQFEAVLKIAYAPLVFVVKHRIQPFADVLQWYIGLFR